MGQLGVAASALHVELDQRLAKFSCKRPDSHYFRLY